MNTISLSVDSIASDRTEFTILDGTTYSSPARNTLGAFITVQKINSDSTVASTITVTSNDSDPETDSEWTVPFTQDGWYRASFVVVPDYDAGTTYAIYDVAFDPATNQVFRSKQNANTGNSTANTTWWEEITGNNIGLIAGNEGEANESANIDSTVYEFIVSANSEYGFSNIISEASETYLTSLKIPQDILDTYSLIAVLLDGTYVSSDRSELSRGERLCRRLEGLIETLS